MIDLRKKGLPDTVDIFGKPFKIKTDFRDWLKFGEMIKNPKTTLGEIHNMFVFPCEVPIDESEIKVLLEFYTNSNVTPKDETSNSSDKVIDYIMDGEYIVSSFYQAYKIDLTNIDYMHWHLFKALLIGLPSNTKMVEIMDIRGYTKSNNTDSEEKQRLKLKRLWKLPSTTADDTKILEEINSDFYNC